MPTESDLLDECGHPRPRIDPIAESRLRGSPGERGWRPFVVLSHHRSGSNFLTDVLRSHPTLQVSKEPLAQHLAVFVRRDLELWTSPADVGGEARACLARPFERRYLRDLRRWLDRRGTGFKETRLAEKVGWFSAEVTAVRTIVLVRDPRAVTASILRRPHLVDYWIPLDHLAYLPPTVDRDRARHDVVFRSAVVSAHRYTRHAWLAARLITHRVRHHSGRLRRSDGPARVLSAGSPEEARCRI